MNSTGKLHLLSWTVPSYVIVSILVDLLFWLQHCWRKNQNRFDLLRVSPLNGWKSEIKFCWLVSIFYLQTLFVHNRGLFEIFMFALHQWRIRKSRLRIWCPNDYLHTPQLTEAESLPFLMNMLVALSCRAKLDKCFDGVSKQLLSFMCVRFSLTLKHVKICLVPPKKQNWLQLIVFWAKKGTKNENQLTDTFANRSADMQWRKLIQPIT